jgi:hypothetical protein
MEQDACNEGNETLVLNFWILYWWKYIFSKFCAVHTGD